MVYSFIYLAIGVAFATYWFKRDYEPEYKELQKSGEGVDKGGAELLLMFAAIFWPFKAIYNLAKKGKV